MDDFAASVSLKEDAQEAIELKNLLQCLEPSAEKTK